MKNEITSCSRIVLMRERSGREGSTEKNWDISLCRRRRFFIALHYAGEKLFRWGEKLELNETAKAESFFLLQNKTFLISPNFSNCFIEKSLRNVLRASTGKCESVFLKSTIADKPRQKKKRAEAHDLFVGTCITWHGNVAHFWARIMWLLIFCLLHKPTIYSQKTICWNLSKIYIYSRLTYTVAHGWKQ